MLTVPIVSVPDMPLRLMPVRAAVARGDRVERRVELVGLMNSAVPLFEVIWLLPPGSRMLTVPELCARKPNALVPLTVMSTPPLKL